MSYGEGGRRGRDLMVVELMLPVQTLPITNKAASSNPAHGEVYSIQHIVIKLISDWWQVGGFLRVLRFPPHKKTDNTI